MRCHALVSRPMCPFRLALLLLVGAVSLGGCSNEGRLLVVVESDILVPAPLGQVRVHATRVGDTGVDEHLFDLTAGAEPTGFPFSFVVLPRGPGQRVKIRVEGFSAGVTPCVDPGVPTGCAPPIVSRIVRSGFSPNTTRVLTIRLASSCLGQVDSCAAGTCEEGACVAIPYYPAEILPELVQGREFEVGLPDASFDAGMDAPGLDAPPADAAGLDVPELDVPGLDTPGLDVPMLDVPMLDVPDLDAPVPVDTPPDTPPDAPPDTPPDTPPVPRTCTEIFGTLPGYQLCSETMTSCEFWTSGACFAGCDGRGAGSPLDCWDDSGGRCSRGSLTACINTSIICLCNRIP